MVTSNIQVLSQETIDKIAAGEVVERPSSVAKELVENAIDAGATAITVEIKDGGSTLIRITDNGSGIRKDQVPLAFLRHSTSKITSAADLAGVISSGVSRGGSLQHRRRGPCGADHKTGGSDAGHQLCDRGRPRGLHGGDGAPGTDLPFLCGSSSTTHRPGGSFSNPTTRREPTSLS